MRDRLTAIRRPLLWGSVSYHLMMMNNPVLFPLLARWMSCAADRPKHSRLSAGAFV